MDKFVIEGGTPLHGSVRLGGAKNASFKAMIAATLAQGESRLLNFSHIDDVKITGDIVESIGGTVRSAGERTLFVNSETIAKHKIDAKFGPKSRASSMFLPALLHRFGKAEVPVPGGDKIGARPLGWHMEGLTQMGVRILKQNGSILAEAKKGLSATTYKFPKNSHTGTETLIMAGVLAKGKTIIENAALEPEVDDLIKMLNNMGARVRRRADRVIEVDGVSGLSPTIHKIMPDRNAAVSYACAAIATKGDIIVENAKKADLEAFLDKLDEMGGGYEVGDYGIRFFYKGSLRATDVVTAPEPGFMTDWQPLWAVLLAKAEGTSVIHEAVHEYRFQYVESLKKMGAKIELFTPKISNPEKFYNFREDHSEHLHAAKVTGPTKLSGGKFEVHDLRAGATMVLAALVDGGKTEIMGIEQIDRGYEDLDGKLRSMGAKIERVESRE
jgi:UDP-N-acetylglucosamine 1-carboxyvinyltransferase